MLFPTATNAHESPAPANLYPYRSRRESAPSSLLLQRDRQFQTRAASLLTAQSFRQTDLRWPVAAATNHFLALKKPVSADSQRAGAVHQVQIPLPNSLRRPIAGRP